jgi:Na+/H+-dicarboxylate symporter
MTRRRPLFSALADLKPRSMAPLSEYLGALVKGRLWAKVLLGMVLGLLAGVLLGPATGWLAPGTSATVGNWLALPGRFFLTLIQMIVIPLVFASVIRGLAASEDLEQLRVVGTRVVGVFTVTTALAAAIGIGMALVVQPGNYIPREMLAAAPAPAAADAAPSAPSLAALPEALVTLLPSNPLNAMVQNQMLQVVIFSMIVGVALVTMAPDRSRPLMDLLASVQEVCMTVVRWAMLLAPIAVFGLMAQLAIKTGPRALAGMAAYVATVLGGLVLLYLFYLLVLLMLARASPRQFVRDTREVLLLAFSTSSSAAVMPLSIKTAEERLGVRPGVAQFVVPLGATINMNGTALYQGAATIFLAQVYGVDIGLWGLVAIVAIAVGASVGSPATPGVGIVILAMVLGTVGIPVAGLALILGVDRILDMSRTAINVAGDLTTCKLMDRWLGPPRAKTERSGLAPAPEAEED